MTAEVYFLDGQRQPGSPGPEAIRLPPRTGAAFVLRAGDRLTVIDPEGEQVADLTAFLREDSGEWLSSGRSIDYANNIYLGEGDTLYSNLSRPMLSIDADTAGRHDFLLSPCSPEMFRKIYGIEKPRPSCFGNLARNLAPFGIDAKAIPTTLNIFMNVIPDSETGELTIGVPHSTAGDRLVLVAEADLVVGLTACSAEKSNNGSFKPIDFHVHRIS